MKKIIVFEFCPQWTDETTEAVEQANETIKNGEAVQLKPTSNLIKTDCLSILARNGFQYTYWDNVFIKLKK